MNKLLLIATVLLVGCTSVSKEILLPTQPEKIRIDSRLLQPCEPLLIVDSADNFPSILIRNVEIYDACSTKQRDSIKVIRELTNTTGAENGR